MYKEATKPLMKSDWLEHLELSQLDNTLVELYSKPHGVFCTVSKQEGATLLNNYRRVFVGDPISKALVEAGYEGRVVISREMPSIGISRWLTYQLSNLTLENRWMDSIIVHVFGELPHGPLPFTCRALNPVAVEANEVLNYNRSRSNSNEHDGVYLHHEGKSFHILPSRSIEGLVVAARDHKLVAHVELAEGIRPVIATYRGDSVEEAKALIGQNVCIKYTECVKGRCLNALTSAVVHKEEKSHVAQ